MTSPDLAISRRVAFQGARFVAFLLIAALGLRLARGAGRSYVNEGALPELSMFGSAGAPTFSGTITFSTPGNGDPFSPTTVQDLDLVSSQLTVRFDGLDASRSKRGETAYVGRMAPGFYADHAIQVADARGVPGAPLWVCRNFNYVNGRGCFVPKVSPDGRYVAYGRVGGGGSLCKTYYGMLWGPWVAVADRTGNEVARFEGYSVPEWTPDGRLLMMGAACRAGGVWEADPSLRTASRIDGNLVSTPAGAPAVSPDGRRLAFVWNNQLWSLSLGGRAELTQLTHFPKAVQAAAWSPDGAALAVLLYDVSMPVRSLVLMKADDERSAQVRQLPVYPYGPISWR